MMTATNSKVDARMGSPRACVAFSVLDTVRGVSTLLAGVAARVRRASKAEETESARRRKLRRPGERAILYPLR
jgi:hypothetical protein